MKILIAVALCFMLASCEVYIPAFETYPNIVYRTNDVIIDSQRVYAGYRDYAHYSRQDLENIARRNHYWQYYPPQVVIERPIILDHYRYSQRPTYRHYHR